MRAQNPALLLLSAATTASVLALSGCSTPGTGPAVDTSPDAASVVSVEDPWVKAADEGMTSSFGLVENTGDDDITLVAVESSASDSIELHETSDDGSGAMSMEEKDGGFTIDAGGTLDLAPGGDHIMFIDFDGPLNAGDTVDLTLVFSDDSRLDYDAAIRDFAGAEESYGEGPDEHSGRGAGAGHGDDDLGGGEDS